MHRTCVCLCSSLPLYLEGPKGEGDKGGEGSPVGPGACPSPQLIKAIPNSHESQFRQCAICPLTLPEHPYYSIHSSNTNPTISRRNQIPREAPETQPRGLNALAHPNGPAHGARGSSDRRHLLIPPGPVYPSLIPQAMERRPGLLPLPPRSLYGRLHQG